MTECRNLQLELKDKIEEINLKIDILESIDTEDGLSKVKRNQLRLLYGTLERLQDALI